MRGSPRPPAKGLKQKQYRVLEEAPRGAPWPPVSDHLRRGWPDALYCDPRASPAAGGVLLPGRSGEAVRMAYRASERYLTVSAARL